MAITGVAAEHKMAATAVESTLREQAEVKGTGGMREK